MKIKTLLIIFVVFFKINRIIAEEPIDILNYALNKQREITFSATLISGDNALKNEQYIKQVVNLDGTSYKYLGSDSKNTVFLMNKQGEFILFPYLKIALKKSFNSFMDTIDINKYCQFTMEIKKYDNTEYFVIYRKISDITGFVSYMYDKVPDGIIHFQNKKDKENFIMQAFSGMTVYYIGVDDFFIYRKEDYSFDGKLKNRISYKDVNFSPVIDMNLFCLPQDYKIKLAVSEEDYLMMRHQLGIKSLNSNVVKKNNNKGKQSLLFSGFYITIFFVLSFCFVVTKLLLANKSHKFSKKGGIS